MIRSQVKTQGPNRIKLTVYEGCITITGPIAEALNRDFIVGEELAILFGRGQVVVPSGTAQQGHT